MQVWEKISNLIKDNLVYIIAISIGAAILITGFQLLPKKNAKAPSSPANVEAGQVVLLINEYRSENNLPPLLENQQLKVSSYDKAWDMRENQYFSHHSPKDNKRGLSYIKDIGYDYKYAGENLGIFFNNSNDLVESWKDSESHRKNILNPDFKDVGVTVLTGIYQDTETQFVVAFFATR